MKTNLPSFASLLCSVLLFGPAISRSVAGTPLGTAFTYQGRLLSGSSPATGAYDLTFTLFDSQNGGNPIGQPVILNAVTVTDGIFTASLDFQAAFAGNASWLQISARTGTDPFTTLPRQPLTPAPNALFASRAAGLQIPGNTYSSPESFIGGGSGNTTTGNAAAIGAGRNNIAGGSDSIVGGGYQNAANGHSSTIAGGEFNIASGVGAAVPGGRFNQATGAFSLAAGLGATAGHDGTFVWKDGSLGTFASTGPNQFFAHAAGGFAFMGGVVGIGTITPRSTRAMTLSGLGPNSDWLQLRDAGGTDRWHLAGTGGGMDFVESDVAANRLFLAPGGNVGIGTASPSTKLEVNGTVKAQAFIGDGSKLTNVVKGVSSAPTMVEATLLDQSNFPANSQPNGSNSNIRWQTFKAGLSGTLSNIGIKYRYSSNLALGSSTLKIYAGDGVTTGTELFLGPFPPHAQTGFWGITVSAAVTAGQTYTIVISTPSDPGELAIEENVDNSYPNGRSSTSFPGADWYFQTKVTGNFVPADKVTIGGILGIGDTEPRADRAITIRAVGADSGLIQFRDSDNASRWHIMGPPSGSLDFAQTNEGGVLLSLKPEGIVQVRGEVTCTAVNITSDRNAKKQFTDVAPREVLQKLLQLPISEWEYKEQPGVRHIGPMAQDFRDAFAVGRDEKHITSVDADGVALAAIQGLNEKVDKQDQAREARIHELEETVAELKALIRNSPALQNGGAQGIK